MDAFLDDGMAVIKATNAYLNQLAANDRDKATALAGFINEDPMMVCSLGLEVEGVTMPIRWLVGDGTAYILTNLVPTLNTYDIHIKYKSQKTNGGAGFIFGCRNANELHRFLLVNNAPAGTGKITFYYSSDQAGNSPGNTCDYTSDAIYDVEVNKSSMKVNGVSYPGSLVSRNDGLSSNPICIFTIYNGASIYTGGYVLNNGISFLEERNGWFHFLPMITGKARTAEECYPHVACPAGTKGMIDAISGLFHPNAAGSGSFTIPDISYTHSTP